MIFVIDIGNSHTVTGIYREQKLVSHWRVKTDRHDTGDELAVKYASLFSMNGVYPHDIKGIVVSSVVPKLETAWKECCDILLPKGRSYSPFFVSHATVSHLIDTDLDNPAEIGADRLVNSIAAYSIYASNVIIIDFGTAITFDCVSSSCQYLGGLILPGINLSLEALSTRTARLPHIDISTPPSALIGKNTVDAMKSGILHGYGGMIDSLSQSLKQDFSAEQGCRVIATGGMSSVIDPFTTSIEQCHPFLTLEGLRYIYEKENTRNNHSCSAQKR